MSPKGVREVRGKREGTSAALFTVAWDVLPYEERYELRSAPQLRVDGWRGVCVCGGGGGGAWRARARSQDATT